MPLSTKNRHLFGLITLRAEWDAAWHFRDRKRGGKIAAVEIVTARSGFRASAPTENGKRGALSRAERLLSAPNKTAAQVGEKAGWLRAMGSSRRSA